MTYSWTAGGNGTYTVHLSGPGGSPDYGNIRSTSYSRRAPRTPGLYSWYVSSGGQRTQTFKFIVF